MTHTPITALHARSYARFLQGDVAPAARESWGLQRVLGTLFPVSTADGLCAIEFVDYQIDPPRFDARESLRRGLVYAVALKVTLRLVLWERDGDQRHLHDVKEQELYSGELPAWSERESLITWEGERVPRLQLAEASALDDIRELPGDVQRAILLARQHDRAERGGVSAWRLRALGDHLETVAWQGLHAVVATMRERLERAHARGATARLLPVDVYNPKALIGAWKRFVSKSPLLCAFDALTPLARAAAYGVVALDDGAREALDTTPWGRWMHPLERASELAEVAWETPVDARGFLVDAAAAQSPEPRALGGFVAPDGAEGGAFVLDALLLDDADALDKAAPQALEGAALGGACVRAGRAGTVLRASERRLWVRDDGEEMPRCHALLPPGVPRVRTPFDLRAVVVAGGRYRAGDVLAESGWVREGALCLGRQLTVAPGNGLAHGTCRVSTKAAARLQALRLEKVNVELRDTPEGRQTSSRAIDGADEHSHRHLDVSGIVATGAEVEPGDVLVGRVLRTEVATADGVFEERFIPDAVLATRQAMVVHVDVFSRNNVDRGARHAALGVALYEDVESERDELVALLVASGVDANDPRITAVMDAYRWRIDRVYNGDELPPGVITLVRISLLVRDALAPGDTLADLAGHRWTVADITDDASADVEASGVPSTDRRYVMRLRPSTRPVTTKRPRRTSR